jgi:hypothetical protein
MMMRRGPVVMPRIDHDYGGGLRHDHRSRLADDDRTRRRGRRRIVNASGRKQSRCGN